ncbi:hypothetical protein EYF80_034060 [Liparis tanakae]|uniref:Uncharacterized protein n=1 Tax=Liparis tanakae TaxID=230148 RepID=A0A4Z2GRF1_9TELE|nr:hypothetical protein EYF80_034060 [Liparis tanakae]
MDLGDGFRKENVDTSSFVSSDSSWMSFDLSTDLTSLGSDQVATPPAAPGGWRPFEDRHPRKSSSEPRHRQAAWTETSFLGSDE